MITGNLRPHSFRYLPDIRFLNAVIAVTESELLFPVTPKRLGLPRTEARRGIPGGVRGGNLQSTLPLGVSPAGGHAFRPMEDAGSVLYRAHSDLTVSRQRLEKVKGIELVRLNREQASQTLCFSSRPFVLCGLPVRRLPRNQLLYERRNGHFVLQLTGHPDYGVPFGQDRIVPIFLATLAVHQKSQ